MHVTLRREEPARIEGNGRLPAPELHQHHGVRPWPILLGLAVVAAVAIAIVSRLLQQAALPVGLIQVNGRMEGDLVSISSKYAGRIGKLLVREGDDVKQGQMLVSLEDLESHARLEQAQANLVAAEAQARGAASGVTLMADTTGAQVVQARGLVNQAESGVDSARADLLRAGAAVITSRATARAADAAISSAQAGVDSANAGKTKAVASLRAAESDLETARANTRSADAAVEVARTSWEKAARDAHRYQALLKEGVVSEQMDDQASSAARSAQAQLNAAIQQVSAAKAVESSRQSGVDAAVQQVQSAEAGINQARAQHVAARDQAAAAWAGVRQTEALQTAARHAVGQADARRLQAIGQMKQAQTAPGQVAVSKATQAQALARIAQSRAAVRELRSTLDALSIMAPVSGTVTTRFRDQGEVVAAGTPLLDVVDLDRLYLKVYVPETEIGHVRLNLPARIHVDSFPTDYFEAKVSYISASAEFTPKEVQTPDERVKLVYAVKLSLKANPNHRLTPGMPADAIIQWNPGVEWQKPRW